MATYRALLSLKSSLDDPDSRLSALRLLNLSNNVFNRTFPPELSNLTNLRVLDLYNNNLTGVLPVSVANFHWFEPSTSIPQPPPPSNPKLTPLELQVVDLKKRYPDVLLMVEVGYKYRFFGEDAEIAARNLGIYAHMDHSFLTASVPTFRLNVHVRRLVSAGYKVGVVKQTKTAAIKAHGANRGGPFGRGLSALYTKATLEAAEGVGGGEEGCGGESSYLSCVVDESGNVGNLESEVRIGIVAVEISTGDVVYGEFRDDFMRSGLEAFVLSLSPAQLLLGEPLSKQTEKMLLAFAGPASNVRVERVS
ncbi:hypothetical protein ACLB2K_070373 [Fragaria x ananassa]